MKYVYAQILFVLLAAADVTAVHAARPPAPVPCPETLETETSARLRERLRRSALGRFEATSTETLDQHRGFVLRTRGEDPPVPISLGVARPKSGGRSVDDWSEGSNLFFFNDVGLIHLAEDAMNVNARLLAHSVSRQPGSFRITHGEARARDLQRRHLWRDAFAAADRRDHSFVETIGVTNVALPDDADLETIQNHILVSAQIHFGRRHDYIKPSVREILTHLRIEAAAEEPLPILRTLPATNRTFARDMTARFEGDVLCEVTFPLGSLIALSERARARLMYQILDRADERECTVLITALPDRQGRVLRSDFGFTRWNFVPNGETARSYLNYIRMDEAAVDVLGRLQEEISAADGDHD